MNNGNTQNFELDQLNLDTTSEDWGQNSLERDQRSIGQKAISAPDTTPEQSPTPELGQVTPVMPPGYTEPASDVTAPTPDQSSPQARSFHPQHSMRGDNLSSKAIDILKSDERELAATGDAATFFDKIVTAREEFQGKEATH